MTTQATVMQPTTPSKHHARLRHAYAERLARLVDWCRESDASAARGREVLRLVAHRGPWVTMGADHDIAGWDDGTVAACHDEIARFLRQLAGAAATGSGVLESIPLRFHASAVPLPSRRRPGRVRLAAQGAGRDLVWLQVCQLLHIVGIEHLRVCWCGRVFMRVGKQTFCEPKCQQRKAQAEYRAREKQRDAAALAAARKRRHHVKTTRTR